MLSITFEIPTNFGAFRNTNISDEEWLSLRDTLRTYTDISEALNVSYPFHEKWKTEHNPLFGRISIKYNAQQLYLHIINFYTFLSMVTRNISEPIYNDFYVEESFLLVVFPIEEKKLRLEVFWEDDDSILNDRHISEEDLPVSMRGLDSKLVCLGSLEVPVVLFYKTLIPEAQKVIFIEETLKGNNDYMRSIKENIQKIKETYNIDA